MFDLQQRLWRCRRRSVRHDAALRFGCRRRGRRRRAISGDVDADDALEPGGDATDAAQTRRGSAGAVVGSSGTRTAIVVVVVLSSDCGCGCGGCVIRGGNEGSCEGGR